MEKKKLMNAKNLRSLKYGSLSVVSTAVVIAIAVFLNLLVNYAADNNIVPLKLDLTSNKLYSLGDVSKQIVEGVDKEVMIYAIFTEAEIAGNTDYMDVKELLGQYEKYPNIQVQFVDVDKDPRIINTIDPVNPNDIQKGDIVVKSGNKVKKLYYYDIFTIQYDQYTLQQVISGSNAEQAITGAIKYVTADRTPVIYFTEGHGEYRLDSDLTAIRAVLERNNYEVKALNLLTVEKVPEDAEILIVASPKNDLTPDEATRLKEYMERGSRAVFMFDSYNGESKFANFNEFLKKYNVSLNYDLVRENDANRRIPGNSYHILPDVQSNEINRALEPERFAMIMPETRSLNILNDGESTAAVTSLMKSSSSAVGEQVDQAAGEDISGPLDLAVASEYTGGSELERILVMGSGSFITDNARNTYQDLSYNGLAFFVNSMNWLRDQREDVLIEPKSPDVTTLNISAAQASAMAWIVVALLPLTILGSGAFVWYRRRHL